MTNFIKLAAIAALLTVLTIQDISAQPTRHLEALNDIDEPTFYDIREAYHKMYEEMPDTNRPGYKQFKRWEYFWAPRVFPTGEFPNGAELLRDYGRYNEKYGKYKIQSVKWQMLGPVGSPESDNGVRKQGIGRINVIRISPKDPDLLWAGTASGGVWKSSDHGYSWENFSYTQFMSLGVSDIGLSRTNPDLAYVATGDAESSYDKRFYSIGLIKTTDGGQSWHITGFKTLLEEKRNITRILVNPLNDQELIIGTNDGIFKSKDGGDTWYETKSSNYIKDLEYHPNNPNKVYASSMAYASSNSIFRSIDGGENWETAANLSNAYRIELAVSPAEPDNVYALSATTSYRGFHSIAFSSNSGKSWDIIADTESTRNILGWYEGTGGDSLKGQGTYDLSLAISPNDADEVWTGGINIWNAYDKENYTRRTTWYKQDKYPYVHADIHDLQFSKDGTILYSANDGGLAMSYDGGNEWFDMAEEFSIMQFYKIGVAQDKSTYILCGAQDNGTSIYRNGVWKHVQAGDGMDCHFSPVNSEYAYASLPYGKITRSTDRGSTFRNALTESQTQEKGAWVSPICPDPNLEEVVYAGHYNVWKNDNYGNRKNWEKISDFPHGTTTLRTIVVANDSKTIYAATTTMLYVTYDGGESWTKLQSFSSAISGITIDPDNNKRIWLSFNSYSEAKVYEMIDGEIIDRSGNLINVPVNCIIYQPDSPDRLYIGTDLGVYYTEHSSDVWLRYGDGMPNLVVNDLDIQYQQNKLYAGTFGRGLWGAPLIEDVPEIVDINESGPLTFCEGDSVILEGPEGYQSYLWSDSRTDRVIVVKESGRYTLRAFNSDGSSHVSDPVTVDVLEVGDLVIDPYGDYPVCLGDSVAIRVDFGFETYEWSDGQTGRKIYVKEPGTYTVTGTADNGCVANSEPFAVEFYEEPAEIPTVTQHRNTLKSSSANEYQWYYNDSSIKGATERTLDITEPGAYYVEIECGYVSETFDAIIGVDDPEDIANNFKVYPNPSKGVLNISLQPDTPGEVVITVFNAQGRHIWTFNEKYDGHDISKQLNLELLPAGAYYIQAHYGGKTVFSKVIIE